MEEKKDALSVSQFVQVVNFAFRDAVFPQGAVVEGEVAEYRVSQGKWIWFLLKDEESVISCFATTWKLRQPLEDGLRVRVHGRPKIFNRSGKFTFDVEVVEMVGEGAIRRALELLRKKLDAEGVFAAERKRALPRFPERIGLIASTESAAYTDFMRILGDRWRGVEVVSAHVQVQGAGAVPDIVGAFRWFNAHPDAADVLVLTRGGGSLEDLMAFNDEEVVRAVFSSKIPVIVGVGHERDETLAEFAADVRASTPSNAAERVVPDRQAVLASVASMESGMEAGLREAVAVRERRLYELESRLEAMVRAERTRFETLFAAFRSRFAVFSGRVEAMGSALERDLRLLKSLDPKTVLARGFSIVRGADGKVLRDAATVDAGAAIRVQLHKGSLGAQVTDIDA